MEIDDKLISHLAYLARLKLTDKEGQSLKGNLKEIIDYVEELKKVDVANIEPLVHTVEQTNVWREDETKPSLPADKALQNAPAKQANFFKVPKVIE
ncbi:MAG: Asp-tRNA(Asn)/Glu-tRNA(Gln) amidotransferase subunit GatC [Planctomycetes bacterium]|nr:Asp-tRNA(Asn)/Glu-tRNA(Gln) amidotransferase subunit GatC [Planctomycetota bacterium]